MTHENDQKSFFSPCFTWLILTMLNLTRALSSWKRCWFFLALFTPPHLGKNPLFCLISETIAASWSESFPYCNSSPFPTVIICSNTVSLSFSFLFFFFFFFFFVNLANASIWNGSSLFLWLIGNYICLIFHLTHWLSLLSSLLVALLLSNL